MTKTKELSEVSVAALDAAGVSVTSVAIWLRDAIVENHQSNNNRASLGEDWSQWNGIMHVIDVYGEGPGNEGLWSSIWNHDVQQAVDAELSDMMKDRIADDFGYRIGAAEDLAELQFWLKAADAWARDAGVDVETVYDASDLPTFGGADAYSEGTFSWDDASILKFKSEGWQLEARQ